MLASNDSSEGRARTKRKIATRHKKGSLKCPTERTHVHVRQGRDNCRRSNVAATIVCTARCRLKVRRKGTARTGGHKCRSKRESDVPMAAHITRQRSMLIEEKRESHALKSARRRQSDFREHTSTVRMAVRQSPLIARTLTELSAHFARVAGFNFVMQSYEAFHA